MVVLQFGLLVSVSGHNQNMFSLGADNSDNNKCSQTLKPGGQIGEPPYDLVIVSNAKRSYYDRAGQLQERPGNVYYHVNRPGA